MGYICGNNITVYNEGSNNIKSLFYKYGNNGTSIIKKRIYDVVHTTILFGYNINYDFFRGYRFVDEIYIKQSGEFYNIDLTNTFTQKTEHIVLPCGVFIDDMPVEKLYYLVKEWLEYFKIWQIQGGIYGQFSDDY